MPKTVPVILSGGSGSRLWLMSRQSHPKPYVPLPDGETLIQKTLTRVLEARPDDIALTVTNRDYYFLTRDSFSAHSERRAKSAPPFRYLLEPAGRNTAQAMAESGQLVTFSVQLTGPEMRFDDLYGRAAAVAATA